MYVIVVFQKHDNLIYLPSDVILISEISAGVPTQAPVAPAIIPTSTNTPTNKTIIISTAAITVTILMHKCTPTNKTCQLL